MTWPDPTHLIISALLHTAKRLCNRTFACAICLSADVSIGDMGEWIRMPFGMVSGVGLRRGVLDFGGDRRRRRGSFGVNTMQKWRIDRLSTRVWKDDNISLRRLNSVKEWLCYDIVRFKIELKVEEKLKCKNATKQTQHGDTPVQRISMAKQSCCCSTAYTGIRTHAYASICRISLG